MREVLPAKDILTEAQLTTVSRRSDRIGISLVAHAWGVIALASVLVAVYPHPAIILLAVMVIGSRQLGLVVLMHDAAHAGLCKSPALSRALSQWFCAWPMLADLEVYRRYHLLHHTRTLREGDPDAVLTGHYPISQASLRRKLLRDVTGRSGFAQRKFQVVNAWGARGQTLKRHAAHYWSELGPATLANVILASIFVSSGYWWLYFVCWLLPMFTWYQVVLRLRNIAEHAVVRGPDDPFGVARTTYSNWFERALISPYWVNYHLEHHLIMWIPCYRLTLMNHFLHENGFSPRMQTAASYLEVLREVTSSAIDGNQAGGTGAVGTFGQGYK